MLLNFRIMYFCFIFMLPPLPYLLAPQMGPQGGCTELRVMTLWQYQDEVVKLNGLAIVTELEPCDYHAVYM